MRWFRLPSNKYWMYKDMQPIQPQPVDPTQETYTYSCIIIYINNQMSNRRYSFPSFSFGLSICAISKFSPSPEQCAVLCASAANRRQPSRRRLTMVFLRIYITGEKRRRKCMRMMTGWWKWSKRTHIYREIQEQTGDRSRVNYATFLRIRQVRERDIYL